MNVLVIDDEPDIRMLARMSLERVNHEVLEAASGEEALDVMDAHRPDLIVLDLRLPGIDGWEVLREVRAREDLRDVPILIISAHSSPSTIRRAQQEGVEAYLTKPFTPDQLVESAEQSRAS